MKLIKRTLILFSAILMVSCSWLDVEPEGEATSKKLFETGDGYRSVLSGVYKAMSSSNLYGVELQFGMLDCMSQQYLWGWNYMPQGKSFYEYVAGFEYNNTNVRSRIDAIWAEAYNVIANANNLIQSIEKESDSKFANGEIERKMIMGEAYACRALMHFDLCRMFAPAPIENEKGNFIPYVDLYPTIQANSIETSEVLNKVVADLNKALELTELFDTTALGCSVSASGRARFNGELEYGTEGYQNEKSLDDFFLGRGYRLSYYAIKGMLSRVHHYIGNYDKSKQYAKEVIEAQCTRKDGGKIDMFKSEEFYGLQAAAYRGFEDITDLKVKSTLLFALFNDMAYDNYNLESYFKKKVTDNNLGSWFIIDMDNQKIFKRVADDVDEYERDMRGKSWTFAPDYQGFYSPRYISAKWYCSDNEITRKGNVQILPVLRISELRFIMAECEARGGNISGAYDIIDEMRSNRGLREQLERKSTLNEFLADMTREYQREFISEGQLFYLYKRLGSEVQIGRTKRKMSKAEYMFPIPINQNM